MASDLQHALQKIQCRRLVSKFYRWIIENKNSYVHVFSDMRDLSKVFSFP